MATIQLNPEDGISNFIINLSTSVNITTLIAKTISEIIQFSFINVNKQTTLHIIETSGINYKM